MARPRSGIEPRIVRAARVRFLAEGVDGASLRTIARDAKTSLGMVSYYFPSRDELFLAVIEEAYVKLLADLETIVARRASLRQRIRRLSERLGAMSDHELEVVRLVVREALSSSSRFRRVVARFQRGHIPILLRVLAEGVESGELDATIPLPMHFVSTLALVALPQVFRRVAADDVFAAVFPNAEETARHASQILFRGVAAKK
jgi:AcrR family transcriptional regulator